MSLKTSIDTLVADAAIAHNIIHGGSSSTVTTDGGPVKTVAKAVADAEAAIVIGAGSYLAQCQAETLNATGQALTATAQAALAAGYAASAASVIQQDLSAISKTFFPGAVVAMCHDWDGRVTPYDGWRDRCSHTSWENETLSGNWLGYCTNETAARAVSGATTGSYYYDTTAAKFYTLNAGSGKTETFRGNARKFPAARLVTVEASRVIIWDLTQASVPMWMVFYSTTGFAWNGGNASSVAMLNGILALGNAWQFLQYHFVADKITSKHSSASAVGTWAKPIASRNAANTLIVDGSAVIVNAAINAVAMTVLPNAPVDVTTGLPVPTIAVATDGNATYSTSVIKDDGTVVNVASDSAGTAVGVEFDGLALKVIRSDGNVYYWNDVRALTTGASPSATVSASTTPAALGTASKQAKRALSSSTGVTLMMRNQAALASSMLAYITKGYTSGWLPGDIRGAWLADTTVETITGTELVTNGTFADTSSWTERNGAGLAAAANELTVTNAGATYGGGLQSFAVTVGKTYTLKGEIRKGTCTTVWLNAGTTSAGAEYGSQAVTSGTSTPVAITLVATSATLYVGLLNDNTNNGIGMFKNVSCRLADVDRSVKGKGLQVFGSLTKAAVASGAQLVGYSGFSASNKLYDSRPSNLDFGTGDWCVMGWMRSDAVAASTQYAFQLGDGSNNIQVGRTTSGGVTYPLTPLALVNGNGWAGTTAGLPQMVAGSWFFLVLMRVGGYCYFYVNGVLIGSFGTAVNLGSAGTLTIGTPVTTWESSISLWRASATTPSIEQLQHIYETEKKLFEANANCLIAGTSNAITALAYDDATDQLHVGTSYGRSTFKGLVRTSSQATAIGAITALAAGNGVICEGGASGADVYVPAYLLREELARKAEQAAKFGQALVAHDFTATASQTTFTLPVGWEIVAVYQQGAIKRETTSWTRSFDGFKWSVVLGTGATVSDWISILAKRVPQ